MLYSRETVECDFLGPFLGVLAEGQWGTQKSRFLAFLWF
jgi:hypothetical protein